MMSKQYKVDVLNAETNKHERVYVGIWQDCVRKAYELVMAEYPFPLVGMPSWAKKYGVHMQGDEYKPGYVAYNHPGSLAGSRMWIIISDANPPPEPKREPFDCDGAIRESAQMMFDELQKPENADLVEAVKGVGSHDGPGGNFMFGFTWSEPKSFFDDDEYVKSLIEKNKQVPLNREQTERWDGIVDAADRHGHSGASYGMACRCLQSLLKEAELES